MRELVPWNRLAPTRTALLGWVVLALLGPAGRSAAQSFSDSPYAVPVVLPACATSDPEVRIIDSVADWAGINDPAARVFCVRPGNYTTAELIRLTVSGTAARPRVIRYEDPAVAQPAHPVKLASSKRAIVRALDLAGADHWLIEGLTIQNATYTGLRLHDADDNVLSRLLIQNAALGLLKIAGASSRNVLQNSVLRQTPMVRDADRGCLLMENPGVGRNQVGNRIVQNEIYDCTDGIQLHLPSEVAGGYFPGAVIDGNDIYLTPARYSNCRGVLSPTGRCACAENGIDIKAAGTGSSADQVVSITDNRIWGWRETDHGVNGDDQNRCGGSGSWGDLVVASAQSSHVSFRGNRLFDGPRGIAIGTGIHHLVVTNNVFHGLAGGFAADGFGIGLAGRDNQVRGNVVVASDAWMGFWSLEVERNQASCNVVIGSGAAAGTNPGGGNSFDYNAYYGTTQGKAAGPHDVVVADASQAQGAELCFWRKRWTNPERVCLAHGTYAVPTALASACAALPPSPGLSPPAAPVLLGP